MIHPPLAQPVRTDKCGNVFIEYDWYPGYLPGNVVLDEMSYPDTSYSFTSFFSKQPDAFHLGYASGNYGHGVFTTGENGKIVIGKYVVLQCTRLFCNKQITIGDHCMFSWGSTITDSWVYNGYLSIEHRRRLLEAAAQKINRHIEFESVQPVHINENVWVGFEATILPGVNIGKGAIIGSKSVIVEDVPEYAVVVGNPGKVVRYLEPTDQLPEHILMIEALKNRTI